MALTPEPSTNCLTPLVIARCDLFALSLRKHEEIKAGMPAKSVDESGIKRAETLAHRGNEAYRDVDVIAWLTQQQNERKKEATRG